MRIVIIFSLICVFFTTALSGAGYAVMTNDFRRFTPSESTYLFPYLVHRLPFPRLTLKVGIINQLRRAHKIKY
ncbi:hypothetical protein V3C99_016198 [Haemonchus contortus]